LLYTAEKKGMERGIEKGIKRGKEVGKKEAKIEIAKNLLFANIDIETIIKSTKLTVKEIEELKKQI
jgi:predicted transposase/invertase (TIGR01784 family)